MTAHQRMATVDWVQHAQRLSERHRAWTDNVPAVDIDATGGQLLTAAFVEYDNKEPVALIDYKDHRTRHLKDTDPSLIVLTRLATRAGLPFYTVVYTDNGDEPWSWTFTVHSCTMLAAEQRLFPQLVGQFTEQDYVYWLLRIRGWKPTAAKKEATT